MRKRLTFFLVLLVLAGCGLLPRKKEPEAAYSVAFISAEGLSLYRAGGAPVLLWKGKNLHNPRFSRDGKSVFFNESSDLFCLPLAGGKRVLAAKNAKPVGFDQKGRLLSLSPTIAAAFDPETGESETLFETPAGSKLAAFLLSPDEMRQAYTVYTEDAGRKIAEGLFVTIPGAPDRLVFSAAEISGRQLALPIPLAWATDGSALLVSVAGSTGAETLYIVPIADGSPVPLSKKWSLLRFDDSFSPGGGSALLPVWKQKDDAQPTLLQINLFSFALTFLHSPPDTLTGATISADGEMTAYTTDRGIFTLWAGKTVQISAAEPEQVFQAPALSRNRQQLFVLRQTGEAAADFCLSPANSTGLAVLFSGVLPPDETIGQRFEDRFDVYEPAGKVK